MIDEDARLPRSDAGPKALDGSPEVPRASAIQQGRERARQVVRASGFVGLTASMLPGMLAHVSRSAPEQREAVRQRWIRAWARGLLHLFAVEARVLGEAPPPGDRGRLIVANHRSTIDIAVLLSTFGGIMVSRHDVSTWPVVGAAARSVGTIFVDRSSAKSGAMTIRTIQEHLEQGRTIVLFPEGTTFHGDEVRPFHGGAFVAAARASAEVLPVGLAYPDAAGAAFVGESFMTHLARMAKSPASHMVAAIGEQFRVLRGDRGPEIASRARAAVQELVVRARADCGP